MKKENNNKYRNVLFIRYLIIYLVIFSTTSFFLFLDVKKSVTEIYTRNNENAGEIMRYEILTSVSELLSDLHFLTQQVQHFNDFENDTKRHLQETFFLYSEAKRYFDQIRYLDNKGNEIVRVDHKKQNAVIIPDSLLQYKGDRYYYPRTMELNKGEVFWSLFDLNLEHGVVEVPYKPTIRISQPVFDKNGHKFGMVILNYLGRYLIDVINRNSIETTGDVLFINHKGYYYKGIQAENEWGFMFKDKMNNTFPNDFPREWAELNNQKKDEGRIVSPNGIFSYYTFSPTIRKSTMDDSFSNNVEICMMETCNWRIIIFLPAQKIKELVFKEFQVWIIIGTIFSLIVIFLLWILASRTNHRRIDREIIVSKNVLLSKQNEELSNLNVTKDKLFSIIAHDLRNPFGSFKSIIDLMVEMKDTLEKHEVDDLLLSIQESADNTYRLLENLLMWTRSQQNRITISLKSLDVGEIISRNIKLFKTVAEKKDIELKSIGKIHHQALADENLIDTVIRNLVSNAIKFTPNGGTVQVTTVELDDMITVKISDTGVGMTEEVKKGLFGLTASRSTRGTNNEEGTGLGLIICKEFVEKNGGEISVLSNPGEGSTFAFTVKKA